LQGRLTFVQSFAGKVPVLELKSFKTAAAELGIPREAMPYVVALCGVRHRAVPHNSLMKGLSRADVAKIRRELLGHGFKVKAKVSVDGMVAEAVA
jgi:hypothetical protein